MVAKQETENFCKCFFFFYHYGFSLKRPAFDTDVCVLEPGLYLITVRQVAQP